MLLSEVADAQDPDITVEECAFFIDNDGDTEGDTPFQTGDDLFIVQDSLVVGGCSFKLNAPKEVSLQIETDLIDWNARVEIFRTPDRVSREEYWLYPGDFELPRLQGDMEIKFNFTKGFTPRSIKTVTVPARYRDLDYEHQVQIPKLFRLLGISSIAADGRIDRLERNVQSASLAYINANQRAVDAEDELAEWASTIATHWLQEGYPRVAEDIIHDASNRETDAERTGASWMWLAIATWLVIIILIAGCIVYYIVAVRNNTEGDVRPHSDINDPM